MIDLDGSIWEQRHGQGYRGAVKTPADIARYELMLARVAPVAWVVEMGTYNGASACWFADEAACQVVTVDTHPQVGEETRTHPAVTWITGNSTAPDVIAYVHGLVRGAEGAVVVVLDSDHSAEHVYAEMAAYSGLVTPGSYLVVEDGIVRWLPEQLVHYKDSSPLDAIERFVEQNDGWAVDAELEDLSPTTQHPKGFLRRLK